jgi:hypothetical protein
MSNPTVASTRETRIKDVDHLQKDAGHLVADVGKHASAHVDAVKNSVTDSFDLARNFAREHPLKLAAGALFLGFLLGTFRRK